jgi:hypothetical protein
MQSVILRYTESCEQLGEAGYQVVRRNSHSLDCAAMFASQNARTLAHDILEHWDYRQTDMNLQELVAIGSTFAHRQADFYNMMGNYFFASEVAEQLYYVGFVPDKLPRSANDTVKDEIDYYWKDVKQHFMDEYREPMQNSRQLKSVAYRYLSRGYNHVMGINCRYGIGSFSRMFYEMTEVLERGLKYVDTFEGAELKLEYSFKNSRIVLSQNVETFDDNDNLKVYREVLATN